MGSSHKKSKLLFHNGSFKEQAPKKVLMCDTPKPTLNPKPPNLKLTDPLMGRDVRAQNAARCSKPGGHVKCWQVGLLAQSALSCVAWRA